MRREDGISVVGRWQEAANGRDVSRLLELSDPGISLSGPRGSGYGRGHDLLFGWLSRAGLRMKTRRVFSRGDVVVADQHGVWRSAETGEVTGEADFATRFVVRDGRVAELSRYDGDGGLDLALGEAGLSREDEA